MPVSFAAETGVLRLRSARPGEGIKRGPGTEPGRPDKKKRSAFLGIGANERKCRPFLCPIAAVGRAGKPKKQEPGNQKARTGKPKSRSRETDARFPKI